MRSVPIYLTIFLTSAFCLMSAPSSALDQPDREGPPQLMILSWDLPGVGAGPVAVNPSDGTLWTFFHQTGNLVSLDPVDGSVLIDVPLTIRPTALDFCEFGMGLYLVGEPLDDQIIDRGVVQAINSATGEVAAEIELEGACNAVYSKDFGTVYVACGMQYAYEGTLYKLSVDFDEEENLVIEIESKVSCGKIPWSIASRGGVIYVTDLELQWTAQPDGTMGPPYGAWVWAYDEGTLDYIDKSWVGINPSKLVESGAGILVACSGSKQGEGSLIEPAFSLITEPGESDPFFIGTAGAGDLDVSPDGVFAVAVLSDWGPPAAWSFMSSLPDSVHGTFPDLKRWVFTPDLAVINLDDGGISASRIENISDSYLRSVAFSLDGEYIYALQGEPEKLLRIPVEMIQTELED